MFSISLKSLFSNCEICTAFNLCLFAYASHLHTCLLYIFPIIIYIPREMEKHYIIVVANNSLICLALPISVASFNTLSHSKLAVQEPPQLSKTFHKLQRLMF